MTQLEDTAEREWLQRLREGDQQAFELIYHRYKLRLTGNLLRILKSADLVEDVIHDVFMGIWENRQQIDPERSIKPYLFQAAANRAHNIFRKAANEQKFREYLLPNWEEHHSHVEEMLLQKENRQLLDELLNQLSPQQREVYRLCKLDGRTYREVAEQLQISETTVNTHIRHANQKLKELTANDRRFLWSAIGALLLFYLQ